MNKLVMRASIVGILITAGINAAIPGIAHAESLNDARELVRQFSSTIGHTLDSVSVQTALKYPGGALPAPAWTDGHTIWYVSSATHNPVLSDTDELALVLAKEGEQARQYQQAPFNGDDCYAEELAGQTALGKFWSWLWFDNPPNVVYNQMESAAASDVAHPEVNASFGCAVLFQGLHW